MGMCNTRLPLLLLCLAYTVSGIFDVDFTEAYVPLYRYATQGDDGRLFMNRYGDYAEWERDDFDSLAKGSTKATSTTTFISFALDPAHEKAGDVFYFTFTEDSETHYFVLTAPGLSDDDSEFQFTYGDSETVSINTTESVAAAHYCVAVRFTLTEGTSGDVEIFFSKDGSTITGASGNSTFDTDLYSAGTFHYRYLGGRPVTFTGNGVIGYIEGIVGYNSPLSVADMNDVCSYTPYPTASPTTAAPSSSPVVVPVEETITLYEGFTDPDYSVDTFGTAQVINDSFAQFDGTEDSFVKTRNADGYLVSEFEPTDSTVVISFSLDDEHTEEAFIFRFELLDYEYSYNGYTTIYSLKAPANADAADGFEFQNYISGEEVEGIFTSSSAGEGSYCLAIVMEVIDGTSGNTTIYSSSETDDPSGPIATGTFDRDMHTGGLAKNVTFGGHYGGASISGSIDEIFIFSGALTKDLINLLCHPPQPTSAPSTSPSISPSMSPTLSPSDAPTTNPTTTPTVALTDSPTTATPTTMAPTTAAPTTKAPTTTAPTSAPVVATESEESSSNGGGMDVNTETLGNVLGSIAFAVVSISIFYVLFYRMRSQEEEPAGVSNA